MKRVFYITALMVLIPFLSGCTTYVQPPPPPYPGAVWVAGHYGPYGGWHPGHWRPAY